jgi:membrane protease YdiL (CAAX protease family)
MVQTMKTTGRKIAAVLEVILVRFVAFPVIVWLVTEGTPRFQAWQTERLLLPFPVTGHLVMIAISVGILWVTRRDWVAYGLRLQPLRYHLHITGLCFIPVVLANLPFGLGVDYRTWRGAWILAIVRVSLLLVLGRLLQKEPHLGHVSLAAMIWVGMSDGFIGKAIAEFVTYGIFVGFGEEILFRGYIQSRLNEAFGRPYRFFSVPYGWGLIIASILFGITHVGLTTSLIT